ncbi:siderophore-interacting protein [Rugamonas sp. FT107W]|uniref:Siderophore-interacting protein n=1 Tax=Duganella vulcania TaxID=2692166 RepID=A0A845HCW2_9BURK|nr:siderophore-interacting protein [Duganella vulcania]MYN15263.1 siderophore-interacting protein [Duganella vulcania]
MNDILPPTLQRRPGRLEAAVLKLFTRNAQVLHVEDIGPAFRLITLGGEALRNIAWTPGDKLQIQLGGWVQRTYTPMDWDTESGRTRILVYLHADGPGTHWARLVRKGDDCTVFGPRRSLRLEQPRGRAILFGDETSLGLAVALSGQAAPLRMVFEVSSLAEAAPVIRQLGLDDAHLCVRREGGEHFNELDAHMSALLQSHPSAEIVLTGKAGSIQHVSRLLRQQGATAGRRQSKAYWAPGKAGMD